MFRSFRNHRVLSAFLISSFLMSLPANAARLRLVGANLTSGNNQSYDGGHGARILQGSAPDVVMIQEFNYGSNSETDIRSFVTSTFGAGFSYFREAGAQIPNGIISRYPILEAGEWTDTSVSNRDFCWARIDIPGDKDLWAVSIHFLTSSSTARNVEATALVNYIKAAVPEGDYLVIGGNFNSDTRSESQFTTLTQVVSTAAPHPADKNGNANTNANRNKPYDSVFVNAGLLAYKVPVVIGNSIFANGLVADTRVYTPISEISPAESSDSGATNMQHMAIVKDFMLPDPLVITSASPLGGGIVGAPVSLSLTATGGAPGFTWSVSSGQTPTGLSLNSDGTLAGTPSSAGTFTFTAQVQDSAATVATATKEFSITIREPLAIFLEEHDLTPTDAALDGDDDGLANILEFILGGNPEVVDSAAILPVLNASAQPGRLSFEFSVPTNPGSVSWVVQWTEDFAVWNEVAAGEDGATITRMPAIGERQTVIVELSAPEGRRFIRLKASGELQ